MCGDSCEISSTTVESRPYEGQGKERREYTPIFWEAQWSRRFNSGSSLTTPAVSRVCSSFFCFLRAHPCRGADEPFSSANDSPSITFHSRSPFSLSPVSVHQSGVAH